MKLYNTTKLNEICIVFKDIKEQVYILEENFI